jgi:uncharacterized protein YegL
MSSVESTKIKTYNLMILDKSGSMGSVRKETISGLNEQLDSMKKAEKDYKEQEQKICLVTFSSEVEITEFWNKTVSDIPVFSNENYDPDGMTALYDAIAMGINKLKAEIKDELAERTANVIVTIFTDGAENVSKKYNGTQVKKLIEEVKETGQWTIAFVGCGDNVFEVAASIGISKGNTMSYMAGSAGTANAFTQMSAARSMRSATYSSCIASGIDTKDLNQNADFFAIDIGTDSDILNNKVDDKK